VQFKFFTTNDLQHIPSGEIMKEPDSILIAEDDPGHTALIRRNLKRCGIEKNVIYFSDGQEALDFLFQNGPGPKREKDKRYLLILDIRMPKVDGVEVLRQIKEDDHLKKLPVIILTTTDDPREIDSCYRLGCSNYIHKPINYEQFSQTIQSLGHFVGTMEFPALNGIA